MAGGSYIEPYPRDEPCDEHTENIAIISTRDTMCFGEPIPDLVRRVCGNIRDHGDFIKTRENEAASELLERSCPEKGSSGEETRDAQKQLLTHSLWLVDHQTLLAEEFWTSLCFQVRNLPDETEVYTWVRNDHDDFEEIKSDISSQFLNVHIATSQSDIEKLVHGYIGFRVNPNGSEQTVIEWSHKVADKIDDIH